MKILVTGASGFIGGALARRLLEGKSTVRILARSPESVSALAESGADVAVGDVTSPQSCADAVKGVETVFHCAGVLGGWGVKDSLLWRVNYEGTANMLEASRKAKTGRFIHVSSCGIFGPLKKGDVAGDDWPYNPTNTYERTKADAEKLALDYGQKGLPITVIRPEFVYGPGDLHLLSLFKAVAAKRFAFIGMGNSTLHPTYIDDVVDALVASSLADGAKGLAMNVAGEKPATVREFIGLMCEALGSPLPSIHIPVPVAKAAGLFFDCTIGLVAKPPLTFAQVGYLTENRAFSYERAKKVIGYSPKVGLREGVKRTVAWYRSEGLLRGGSRHEPG